MKKTTNSRLENQFPSTNFDDLLSGTRKPLRKHHYHIFSKYGTHGEIIHEGKFKTKKEAIKEITKLKRGYERIYDKDGNFLYIDTLRWEGQAKYGYVESREIYFVIYGQKHTIQCEQIHSSCEAEAGWSIMGWD